MVGWETGLDWVGWVGSEVLEEDKGGAVEGTIDEGAEDKGGADAELDGNKGVAVYLLNKLLDGKQSSKNLKEGKLDEVRFWLFQQHVDDVVQLKRHVEEYKEFAAADFDDAIAKDLIDLELTDCAMVGCLDSYNELHICDGCTGGCKFIGNGADVTEGAVEMAEKIMTMHEHGDLCFPGCEIVTASKLDGQLRGRIKLHDSSIANGIVGVDNCGVGGHYLRKAVKVMFNERLQTRWVFARHSPRRATYHASLCEVASLTLPNRHRDQISPGGSPLNRPLLWPPKPRRGLLSCQLYVPGIGACRPGKTIGQFGEVKARPGSF
ncbi:hypothetical protein RJ640_020455 [Escallonia rubra]|uniref:Uncharacterized protein n=1 Tax=Escallonia rubra TaxID=112253 RepID=A0AA88U7F9_9ASTE|nr:hypothetical protein RJ640_020455 [Escallonia rubra]